MSRFQPLPLALVMMLAGCEEPLSKDIPETPRLNDAFPTAPANARGPNAVVAEPSGTTATEQPVKPKSDAGAPKPKGIPL